MTRTLRRLVGVFALAVVALVAAASPSHADSAYDIEPWMGEHGYPGIWVYWDDTQGDAGLGVSFTVNYDTDAESEAAFQEEARAAAEVFWERADYRVDRVIVYARNSTDWSAPGLPAAVTFERSDLVEAFGDRPAGLDDHGQGDIEGELNGDFFGAGSFEVLIGFGVIALGIFALGAGLGWLVTFLVMRRKRAAPPPGFGAWGPYPYGQAYGQPPVPGQPAPYGQLSPYAQPPASDPPAQPGPRPDRPMAPPS